MCKYGYVRVSSRDQNPSRQLEALREADISDNNIFIDKLSGKDFKRPSYIKLLKKVKPGDLIIILSIDRLGRDYDEILEQWRIITKEKHVDIEVIDMPLLNTNSERDGLTGTFISDLVLQILAYVAETERTFIKQRQAEGIACAKANGIHFGAKRKELPEEFYELYDLWLNGDISLRHAAEKLGVSHTTFHRRCKEMMNEELIGNNCK